MHTGASLAKVRVPQSEGMTPRSRLLTGLFLLALFGGVLAIITPFTLGRAFLDAAGTTARATVVDKHSGTIWNRWRGRRPVYSLSVRYEDRAGTRINAKRSVTRETYETARQGGSVDFTFLPAFPMLSTIEPADWNDPWFLGGTGFAVVLLWLCMSVLFRLFVPPE